MPVIHKCSTSDRPLGVALTAFFLIVGQTPLLYGNAPCIWALPLAASFFVVAWIVPSILSPFRRLWINFGLLLHCIVGLVALGILFFAVVTPIGLLMRLLCKDFMRLRLDKNATSYWIVRTQRISEPESFNNQF